jgi:uncharacterized cysteine cluster protein YcgN (CxxCxxCC family)
MCSGSGTCALREFKTLQPVVTVRTARFNIQQFYVLPTQCVYVLCGSQNKQRLFAYTALTGLSS